MRRALAVASCPARQTKSAAVKTIKMQLKDIFTKEQSRSEIVQLRTIYLVPEGTFYRAYEWSAWLCHRYVSQFKPTHRLLKNTEDSVVFVGFPMTSLERHIPEGATVAEQEDKTIALVLAENVFGETTTEQLQTDYANWKKSVPLVKSKEQGTKNQEQGAKNQDKNGMTDVSVDRIMKRILAYPIEQHSPMEAMAFLSEIKQQLSERVTIS